MMKKLMMLFVMLAPMILFAQAQPLANNIGITTNKQFDVPSANRSVPPGTLFWSQLPACDNAWASQYAANSPFDAKLADDFLFAAVPGQITAVRWWVLWFNGTYLAPSSFNVIIYNDNSCLPGSVVASWNIPYASANEDAGCSSTYDSREYWVTLSPAFLPAAGQHYWIQLQPVMDFPPQTGNIRSTGNNLCSAQLSFPEAGFGDWTALNEDISFELYGGAIPPVATPVSTWALLLGGVLIAAVVFMRYRSI